MRRILLAAVVAFVLLVGVGPAGAITYGQPDGTGHPYVGLVVFYDAAGNPTHRCSGTLLSSSVFLTAGHCTFGTASAQVWFQPVVTFDIGYPFTGGVTGSTYTHPGFTGALVLPNTNDLGIVVLDKRVRLDTYGVLPPLGYLDDLAARRGLKDITMTVVGYGLQSVIPELSALRERWWGSSQLENIESALTDGYNLQTSNDPGKGTGSGGTCSGDSGGPIFHGGYTSNLVVGVNSFGLNPNCVGNDFSYRTDIPNAQDFIGEFLR